ncbi:MAG: VWA domain-containing protein [Planctomycetales bacterium]
MTSFQRPTMNSPRAWLGVWLLVCFAISPAWGAEKVPLTGARLLARIDRQSSEIRPPVFTPEKIPARCQIAILMDGTTSMDRELADLAAYLPEIADLLGNQISDSVQVAVVVYRDQHAPSGIVSVVSDFTSDLKGLAEKVRPLKAETGEPYFPEAMDQGLQTALEKLSWKSEDADTLRRLVIIGDAPPYTQEHPNRKYKDADLNALIDKRKVRVDALLVTSGLSEKESGAVGTSRESASQAAPYAREFLTALTNRTKGTFVDFWDAGQIGSLQEPIVTVTEVGPLPAADSKAGTKPVDAWKAFLGKQFNSVRAERPAVKGMLALVQADLKPSKGKGLFPATYSREQLQAAVDGLNEALLEEPENATLHLLLANVHALGAVLDGYEDHTQEMVRHVALAKQFASDSVSEQVRQEIDALHALYLRGDAAGATQLLEKLNVADIDSKSPGCGLRTTWGLLALKLGFWPATAKLPEREADEAASRKLILQILKQWPESVEAMALRNLTHDGRDTTIEIPRSLFVSPRAN